VAGGARRVGAGLARRGFAKGDVLAIYSPNLPEYALAFHGAVMVGGVVTTANPLYTPEELGHQLRDTGAKYLVTVPPFLDKACEAARGTAVREIFVFGETQSPDEEAGEVPKAFVVLRQPLLPTELMDWVAGRVAPHKKIRRLEVVDTIPKSASGKILRRVLVEQERAAQTR
jgi:acyl-CoA synthetase (AMP-forming)/AMP-acid ligase II